MNRSSNRGFIQRQGDLHEEAALKLIGGDAENLNNNEKLESMGLRGNNYPNFDVFSSSEVCSVKSHINQDGSANVQSYMNDFSNMLGWGKAHEGGLSPLEQDAKRIKQSASMGVPVPTDLVGAGSEKVVSYLQDNSIMRIPSDHVPEVRDALVEDAKQLPGKYFLPESPSEAQFENLSERVQSTGLSASETLEKMNSKEQTPSKDNPEKAVQNSIESIPESITDEAMPESSENEAYDYYYRY